MADLRENIDLVRAERELQVEQLKLSIKQAEFRILQLKDDISRNEMNIEATHKAISEIEKELKTNG